MSLGLVLLEEKLFTRTPTRTPQSDAIMSADKLADIIITRPMHQRTDANLYPPERQLTKASELSFDLEGGAKSDIR